MPERRERIVSSAIRLAEEGGFDAVRLRDVAAAAGVALGTLYSRFRSKEDILIAALALEIDRFRELMLRHPAEGETGLERVVYLFTLASRTLFMRPKLAKAGLRAVASGDVELAGRVAAFHDVVTRMVVSAYHGCDDESALPTPEERTVGNMLQRIWFASLVGWMGNLHDEQAVIEDMREASTLIIRGFELGVATH